MRVRRFAARRVIKQKGQAGGLALLFYWPSGTMRRRRVTITGPLETPLPRGSTGAEDD